MREMIEKLYFFFTFQTNEKLKSTVYEIEMKKRCMYTFTWEFEKDF